MRACNAGTVDRAIRIVVGLVALWLGLRQGASALAYVLYAVAAVGLVTGVVGWCPLWALLGVNTCARPRA
ncbi:MAG: DUF2892 domain-containing protein [Armatimonadota bacterium]|nr:DUF2892 domain-containing protein [Armatimonadota bacterium]MDR7444703.1 DUF2892 domain-containing protein [Armatimonadota bacterium]MDR7571234.1 DUF2892 domain-containing protein [Armatimonadota bacterium]MDR7613293.1 DUF2892 domain-containing protein [Armatimonadota bacterium]